MRNDNIAEVRQIKAQEELSLENLIKTHIKKIDEMQEEIKKHREMFEDSFNNNPTYRECADKAQMANKTKLSMRNHILKEPAVAQLNQKLKDMRTDSKELKKTLSGLLIDYKEKTRASQLELFDRQIVSIVESAKVVKTKRK